MTFITSPFIFNFPAMNNLCACVFPLTSLPKSSSDSDSVTSFAISLCSRTSRYLLHARGSAGPHDASKEFVVYTPSAFAGSPLATSPFSFRSMYQDPVCPSLFLSVKAKIALPFFTASFRSVASDWREELIASKATEEGKASVKR